MSILSYVKCKRAKPFVNAAMTQQAGLSAQEQRYINDSIATTTPSVKQRKARHGVRYDFKDSAENINAFKTVVRINSCSR